MRIIATHSFCRLVQYQQFNIGLREYFLIRTEALSFLLFELAMRYYVTGANELGMAFSRNRKSSLIKAACGEFRLARSHLSLT